MLMWTPLRRWFPQELNITIDKALEMNPEFRKLYEEDEQVQHLIDMCKRLEGLPRHTSMHAAGVVICQNGGWNLYLCPEAPTVPSSPSLP